MDKLTEIIDAIRANGRLMVDRPEDAVFRIFPTEDAAVVRISVAEADLGRVIRNEGRNPQALRILTFAIGMAAKVKITLDIKNDKLHH